MSVPKSADTKIVPALLQQPPQPHPQTPVAKPPNQLADAIRSWVHFDNMTEHLNKQVSNARNLRNEYENKILHMLESQNMRQTMIKITGATLQHSTRYKQNDLGWTMLREQLRDYYKMKGKPDETDEIMNFLQTSRGGKTVAFLKKTPT